MLLVHPKFATHTPLLKCMQLTDVPHYWSYSLQRPCSSELEAYMQAERRSVLGARQIIQLLSILLVCNECT